MPDLSKLKVKHVNLPWLEDNIIFYAKHGSHAYGTNIANSDEDFKGVAIAPSIYYHGFYKVFEQAESKEPDSVIYNITKFFKLAAECNPNIIEVLWTDPNDHVIVSDIGKILLANKHKFLSRRAKHTFCGYARSQLKRVRTHRRWLRSPPTHQPTRSEFGLPERTLVPADQLAAAEAAIRKELDSWEVDLSGLDDARRIEINGKIERLIEKLGMTTDDKHYRAGKLLSFDDNMLVVLDRERKYTTAITEWQNYQKWKRERNPARAELEARFSYDVKNAYHLVRLLRMSREILVEGIVRVKRPDAEELIAIRHGAWSFDHLIEWSEQQERNMEELYNTSALPKVPNINELDMLCASLIETHWEFLA